MLNEQQEIAKNRIVQWFEATKSGGKQIFTLAGYAGTGKTFLIHHIINNVLDINIDQVASVAPTGKAASVLIQKGTPATTIHRLIYHCQDTGKKSPNGKKILQFIKKKSLDYYKLIVLDEVSMVGKKVLEDLISFGVPILAVGDPGQLQPVMAERHDLLVKPDAILTDIVRQAADDPIINLATKVRNNETLQCGKYGKYAYVINKNSISRESLDKLLRCADQIICGKNTTRMYLNKYVRNLLGKTGNFPNEGDKLICVQNNYTVSVDNAEVYPLVNGCIGYCKSFTEVNPEYNLGQISFSADFVEDPNLDPIIIDDGIFTDNQFCYDMHQKVYELEDGSFYPAMYKTKDTSDKDFSSWASKELHYKLNAKDVIQLSQFEFGYAISCHKAQGSEFDMVIVFDESDCFPAERSRWLYTAITRAKKKLVVIKSYKK